MFGLSKQDKIKKLLIINTKLATTIEKKHSKSLKDKTEIGQLKTERLKIDLLKVCFNYDELKYEYKEFLMLAGKQDTWKLDKPLKSEGAVFTVQPIFLWAITIYIERKNTKSPTLSFDEFSFTFYLNSRLKYQKQSIIASSLVQKGIRHKLAHQLIKKAENLFKKHIKIESISMLINYFLLHEYLNTSSYDAVILSNGTSTLNIELLSNIAKLTNTNIITTKRSFNGIYGTA
jgi:hypothetical protein